MYLLSCENMKQPFMDEGEEITEEKCSLAFLFTLILSYSYQYIFINDSLILAPSFSAKADNNQQEACHEVLSDCSGEGLLGFEHMSVQFL